VPRFKLLYWQAVERTPLESELQTTCSQGMYLLAEHPVTVPLKVVAEHVQELGGASPNVNFACFVTQGKRRNASQGQLAVAPYGTGCETGPVPSSRKPA
jgi:hypothetical protein